MISNHTRKLKRVDTSPARLRNRLVRRWRTALPEFLDDRQGVTAAIFALTAFVLVGFAALAIDGGYLYWTRTQLQVTADAAALAGAALVPKNSGTLTAQEEDNIVAEAKLFTEKNMRSSEYGTVLADADVVLGHWDADGTYGSVRTFYPDTSLPGGAGIDAVKVTARRDAQNGNPVGLVFASVMGFSETDVGATAVAYTDPNGRQACMLSLDPSQDGAIEMSGTNDLDLDGCGIALHSTSEKAMKLSGTTDLDVSEVCVAGTPGVEESGTVTWDPDPPKIVGGCNPPNDPLAGVPEPTVPEGCDYTDFLVSDAFQTVALQPGTYCGGIQVSGANAIITFDPGIFILKGGGMIVAGSDGTFTGDEVMFYNTHDDGGSYGNLDFTAGSNNTVTLTAPRSGTYAGILFFQDRSAEAGDFLFKLAGDSNTFDLDGVIYMPDQLVEFSGNASLSGPCGVKVISKTIKFNGSSVGFPTPGAGCASDNVSITIGTLHALVL